MPNPTRAGRCATRPLSNGVGLSALTVVFVVGCAHVEKFDAAPRSVCQGESVDLSWRARGRVTLESDPDVEGTGSQPSEGSGSFTLEQPTQFDLQVTRLLGDASAQQYIFVAPPKHAYGDVARCADDGRSIELSLPLEKQVGPSFEVGRVRNPLRRRVDVRKDGRVVQLDAGETSAGLSGLRTRGDWHLRSPLDPGEDCNAALRSVRQRLQVEIQLVCGG